MNYVEWADEYYENALRVKNVMERKKAQLNEKNLTADGRKRLCDEIKAYRVIYHELCSVGDTLRGRAGVNSLEA